MLQEAVDLQKNAVRKLTELVEGGAKTVTFRAPTGSGKTHMMAEFMNGMLKEHNDLVFLVSTLSKGELAEQSYGSFQRLCGNGDGVFPNLNPYLIQSEFSADEVPYIPEGYRVYVLPRDLYKEKSVLFENGTLQNFLLYLTRDAKSPKRIILIKDECHIATKNLDRLSEYFSAVINFSATPKKEQMQCDTVVISDREATEAGLIKSLEEGEYPAGKPVARSEFNPEKEEKNLSFALDCFEKVRRQYIHVIQGNPCFMIQISNAERAEEEWDMIRRVLEEKHENLKWALLLDKGKWQGLRSDTNDAGLRKLPVDGWKQAIRKNGSLIDVVIFKLTVSDGYDIPRANMLYQVRDSKSKQLDEQVMGRVRRNPVLTDYTPDNKSRYAFAMKAYVWGILPKGMDVRRVRLKAGVGKQFRAKTTILKNLKRAGGLDVRKIIEESKKQKKPVSKDIFTMYREFMDAKDYVRELWDGLSYQSWFDFVGAIEKIQKEADRMIADYENSLEVEEERSLPERSSFAFQKDYKDTEGKWVWERENKSEDKKEEKSEDKKEEFSFDSEAERDFAKILKEMTGSVYRIDIDGKPVFLWGKNFLDGSEIRYQYYLDGVHSSYPDFVLKDAHERIHLFETKSLNHSSKQDIDSKEYDKKIEALKECYKWASLKTGYTFWIPVLNGSTWQIWYMHDGKDPEMVSENVMKQTIQGKG